MNTIFSKAVLLKWRHKNFPKKKIKEVHHEAYRKKIKSLK